MSDESDRPDRGDPSQVLDVLRDVLMQHMQQGLPDYQVQSAVFIGQHSGRLIGDRNVMDGNDVPGGLRLTMRSGAEYDLTLSFPDDGGAEDKE